MQGLMADDDPAGPLLPPPTQATEALRITANELLRYGVMDEVVPEPLGGAHADPAGAFPAVKTARLAAFDRWVRGVERGGPVFLGGGSNRRPNRKV